MCSPENETRPSETKTSEEVMNAALSEAMKRSAIDNEELKPEDNLILLSEVAGELPETGNSMIMTNLLKLFREYAANPDETEKRDKVEQYIDEQIDRLTDVIEKYNEMPIPPDAGEIHQKVLDSLAINYESLFLLKDLFVNMDFANIKNGFFLLMEADNELAEIANDLHKQVNEMVISTIL